MAHNKVRFSISIPHEANVALERFVKTSGYTKSGFIGDMILQQIDSLNALSDAIELAKTGNKVDSEVALNQAKVVISSLGEGVSKDLE